MAAPRKYSDAQRAAMFALYEQGYTPAEIARKCKLGTASVDRFEIPRRTVQEIVKRPTARPESPKSRAEVPADVPIA